MSRLDEIRARLEAAAPGPWHNERHTMTTSDGFIAVTSNIRENAVCLITDEFSCQAENAEFIANAPTDIAFLLAECHRLRLLIEDGEMRLKELRDLLTGPVWNQLSDRYVIDLVVRAIRDTPEFSNIT